MMPLSLLGPRAIAVIHWFKKMGSTYVLCTRYIFPEDVQPWGKVLLEALPICLTEEYNTTSYHEITLWQDRIECIHKPYIRIIWACETRSWGRVLLLALTKKCVVCGEKIEWNDYVQDDRDDQHADCFFANEGGADFPKMIRGKVVNEKEAR